MSYTLHMLLNKKQKFKKRVLAWIYHYCYKTRMGEWLLMAIAFHKLRQLGKESWFTAVRGIETRIVWPIPSFFIEVQMIAKSNPEGSFEAKVLLVKKDQIEEEKTISMKVTDSFGLHSDPVCCSGSQIWVLMFNTGFQVYVKCCWKRHESF